METKYIESMAKIHNRLMIFLEKFDIVAKEHNVEYYLMGGAAIGSIREGDFLAWDDDLDIIIKEEDFKKFSKINWELYGWSLKNPIKKPHCAINKLYLLDTKVKINGIDDLLFVDVFIGYKQRKMTGIRKTRLLIIDYIMYIRAYSYKDLMAEYGYVWFMVKSIFQLVPVTNYALKKYYNWIIKRARIVSNERRKFYFSYDAYKENIENHYLLEGKEKGVIRGMEVPVPFDLKRTTKPALGDIMKPPKKTPQKPDHDIEIIE